MPDFASDLDHEATIRLIEAMNRSGQAVSIYDGDDVLRYANGTYRGMFIGDFEGPYTFADILRHGARAGIGVRIDGGDVEALIARTLSRRRSEPHKAFETDLVDGRWFWIEQTILPSGWVLTIGADITALKHSEKTLRQAHEAALLASRTDPLTGLPNRRRILELLDEEFSAGRHRGSGLCAAVIDIDRFKAINDTYGHDAGDSVLRHFAHACRGFLKGRGMLGRLGGEEFLLVLPGYGARESMRLIGRIRDGFPPATITENGIELPYAFSAGIAEASPEDGRTSLLRRADGALYLAKEEGRNRTRVAP